MTQPLALVLYERLLPGSQIVNRLQDLNYRVQTIADPGLLVECAEQAKPLLVLADLESTRSNVSQAIGRLRQNLAIISFYSPCKPKAYAALGSDSLTPAG